MRGGPRSNKPEAVRRLHGSRERPRHREKPEPKAPTGRPKKPAHLGPVASRKWRDLVAILEGEKRLTVSDGPWLEVTAEAYAEYRRWKEAAEEAPLTIETEHGPKAHPAQQQARLAWESYRKLLGDGGVTPLARARAVGLATPDDDKEDDFETHARQGAQIRRVK